MEYVHTSLSARMIILTIRIAPIIIAAVGVMVSLGWIFDAPLLTTIYQGAPTMKFSTSVAFIATGVAMYFTVELLTSNRKRLADISHLVLPPSLLIIILFMSVHVTSALLGTSSGIDNLFVRDIQSTYTTVPGRPAETTILSFFLAAAAGMTALQKSRSTTKVFLVNGSLIMLLGMIATVGYFLHIPALYYSISGVSNGMALHTAILFVTLGATMIGLSRVVRISSQVQKIKNEYQSPASSRISGISIQTKFLSILLTVTVIPIMFIGSIVLNNAVSLAPELLAGSVAVLGFATVVSVVFFAFAMSHTLVAPLLSLKRAIHDVATGNYGVEISAESTDEIGLLAEDFKNMKNVVVETNSNLEKLVHERTISLQNSKKQLEIVVEQLKEQERTMKNFISVAAHELKNPVAPILMASQLFIKREVESKITLTRDELNLILRNALRLKALCEQILDVARMENNGIKLEKHEFSVADLARQLIDDLKPTLKPGVDLAFSGQEKTVEADREKVQQVMLNLIQNAIKFTTEGTIQISLTTNSEHELVVSVRDTGNGIDSEILPRLFSKYATNSEKGTGLGLFISKNIIEAHGGRIWAENNPEKGSTFAFSLPSGHVVVRTSEVE